MDTLKEHLAKARRARWAKMTPEERKAHASMMARKRWGDKASNDGPMLGQK